jgi:hypothetical protein
MGTHSRNTGRRLTLGLINSRTLLTSQFRVRFQPSPLPRWRLIFIKGFVAPASVVSLTMVEFCSIDSVNVLKIHSVALRSRFRSVFVHLANMSRTNLMDSRIARMVGNTRM